MTTVLVAENVPVLILTPTANPEYFSVSYDDFSVHLEIRHRCDPFFLKFCQFLIGSFFYDNHPLWLGLQCGIITSLRQPHQYF
jgi:hypothetical protein